MKLLYGSIFLTYLIISISISIVLVVINNSVTDTVPELDVFYFVLHPIKYICKYINDDSRNIFGKLFCIPKIIIFIGPIIFCKILQFICYMVAMIISLGFKE